MVTASLLLNIIVLIPFCTVLLTNNKKAQKVVGPFTTGRGILVAIYLTILLASGVLLFVSDSKLIFMLLMMQIVYKTLSPFTAKTIKNPVIISNLLIVVFHSITIYTMFNSGGLTLAAL